MRTKINQKIVGGASASERLSKIALDSEFLRDDASNVVTSSEILENSVQTMFRGCEASKFLKDDRYDGYYLISDTDRRYVAYQAHDTFERSSALEKLLSGLSSSLYDLREQMKEADRSAVPPAATGLESAIAEWRNAFNLWQSTDKGNGSDLDCDTPEAKLEQQKLAALAVHPCSSLQDVRRKADVFLSRVFLPGLAENFAVNLLRSFATAGGE
ncbi:hypothetical protein ASD74_15100 [Rhizobium sp. Root564]|nr:hypothetical protein ASD74_15100 [Rhizobium sp. Root564]